MTTHAIMVKIVHLTELNLEKKVTGAPLSRSSLVSSNPKKPSPSHSIKQYSYSFKLNGSSVSLFSFRKVGEGGSVES